ncbi:unnamed protein product [Polarella glacialis]|nr:unnamed protein product [Polarella glacialis]
MENRLRAIRESGKELCALLCSAVAALAPPRRIVEKGSGPAMDAVAITRLRAETQKRLRCIVLRILQSGMVELGDPENAPAIQRLRRLLLAFRARTGGDVAGAAAGGEQWARLEQALSAGAGTSESVAGTPSARHSEASTSSVLQASDPFVRWNPEILNLPEVERVHRYVFAASHAASSSIRNGGRAGMANFAYWCPRMAMWTAVA